MTTRKAPKRKRARSAAKHAELLEGLDPMGLCPSPVIAAVFGKTVRRIQQLVVERILPKPTRGLYPLGPTVHAYLEHLEQKIRSAPRSRAVSDASAARARLDTARAEKVELELAEARGTLLPRSQVLKVWGIAVTAARNRMLALPARMIQRAKIDSKTKGILREEIDRALYDLAAGDGIERRVVADKSSEIGNAVEDE